MEKDIEIIGKSREISPDGFCLVLEHSAHWRWWSTIGEVAPILISHTLNTLLRQVRRSDTSYDQHFIFVIYFHSSIYPHSMIPMILTPSE